MDPQAPSSDTSMVSEAVNRRRFLESSCNKLVVRAHATYRGAQVLVRGSGSRGGTAPAWSCCGDRPAAILAPRVAPACPPAQSLSNVALAERGTGNKTGPRDKNACFPCPASCCGVRLILLSALSLFLGKLHSYEAAAWRPRVVLVSSQELKTAVPSSSVS